MKNVEQSITKEKILYLEKNIVFFSKIVMDIYVFLNSSILLNVT